MLGWCHGGHLAADVSACFAGPSGIKDLSPEDVVPCAQPYVAAQHEVDILGHYAQVLREVSDEHAHHLPAEAHQVHMMVCRTSFKDIPFIPPTK